MKKIAIFLLTLVSLTGILLTSCSGKDKPKPEPDPKKYEMAVQNVDRAIQLIDSTIESYFEGTQMIMHRYYNPYTKVRSGEVGSVWMYTSAIEAVNAALEALQALNEQGETELYDNHFSRLSVLLSDLYENLEYYRGTFNLTSYTQTKDWTVFGVNRGRAKGSARVDGIENVYDDQQWLIREMLISYKITSDSKYLQMAEYLTSYVLDGWDCVLDENKVPYGGITWGPGYVTKHACSNGPMVSPLVWLSELYSGKSDQIQYLSIAKDYHRVINTVKKSEYYLQFAKDVYAWQKKYLLRPDNRVYDDMMGGCANGEVTYETIYGVRYRRHENLTKREAPPITYNSGTMLSGAADLYRATSSEQYLNDFKSLTTNSFQYFAKLDADKPGYYSYDISGFRNWFNGVMMRGYVDGYGVNPGTELCIKSFQDNLDYAWENYLYNGLLPTNLLLGWNMNKANNNVEGMFVFAFAAEYAVLSKYELEKAINSIQ